MITYYINLVQDGKKNLLSTSSKKFLALTILVNLHNLHATNMYASKNVFYNKKRLHLEGSVKRHR